MSALRISLSGQELGRKMRGLVRQVQELQCRNYGAF